MFRSLRFRLPALFLLGIVIAGVVAAASYEARRALDTTLGAAVTAGDAVVFA
jgi:hypothetical protein